MRLRLPCISKAILQNHSPKSLQLGRFLSTQEATERRHHLFTLEKNRQLEKVGRVEKIEVRYKGVPNDCTLVMNKDISTPYDCAKHLSEWHVESSALALVDGHVHWDMHRPLTENCTLELQNFTVPEPQPVNKAFWRTCSMMLGAVAATAFKDTVAVKLHSFPGPDIRSGSFIYDVDLPELEDWRPTPQELHTLSAEFVKLARQNLSVERLEVGEALAAEMFSDNRHKAGQVPSIARHNGKVTLYRIGKHVDISKGPMISSTGQVGRATVAAVHALRGAPGGGIKQLYRFQGVGLPVGVILNHFAFSVLTERAKKLREKMAAAFKSVTAGESVVDREPARTVGPNLNREAEQSRTESDDVALALHDSGDGALALQEKEQEGITGKADRRSGKGRTSREKMAAAFKSVTAGESVVDREPARTVGPNLNREAEQSRTESDDVALALHDSGDGALALQEKEQEGITGKADRRSGKGRTSNPARSPVTPWSEDGSPGEPVAATA